MATQFSIQDNKPWKATFFTIWSGQALSILGSQLVQFALIWHLTVQTGSATMLATATLIGMLPNVILGPFIGTLVDRWNRRWIMLIADGIVALATLLLVALFALDIVEVWHIFALLFIRSLASTFLNDPEMVDIAPTIAAAESVDHLRTWASGRVTLP